MDFVLFIVMISKIFRPHYMLFVLLLVDYREAHQFSENIVFVEF